MSIKGAPSRTGAALSPAPVSPPSAPPSAGKHVAPPHRRNLELTLLAAALGVILAALALVDTNLNRPFLSDLSTLAVVYGLILLGAHLAIRRYVPFADPLIFPIVAVLNGMGLVFIFRLGLASAKPDSDPAQRSFVSFDTNPQLLWTLVSVGALVFMLVYLKDYRVLSRYGYTFGAAGVLFLLLPIFSAPVNGSNVWIHLGFITIQPGEFAKIALIICSASLLVVKRDLFIAAGKHVWGIDLPRMRDLGPLLLAWGLAIFTLFLQHDLGMSLLIFGTSLVMLYVATARLSWLIIGISLLAIAAVFAFTQISHVALRAQAWWDPLADCDNVSYQLCEALFGMAVGGLGGSGLGAGSPSRIPEAHNDFILAVAGEEIGLFGLSALILLYFLLVNRGIRIALTIRDSFGKLLAAGLSITLAIQVFVITAGVTDLLPLTGLTTPFMSSGGSSLLSNYLLLAVLLKISHDARKPDSYPTPAPAIGKYKAARHGVSVDDSSATRSSETSTGEQSTTTQIPALSGTAPSENDDLPGKTTS